MKIAYLCAIAATACALVGCGQKGALYHPADTTAAKTANTPIHHEPAPTAGATDGVMTTDTDY